MKLREAQMYEPVKKWLEARGFKVAAEIAFYSSAIDVVGWKAGYVVAVEMKTSLTYHVIRQALRNLSFCDEVYVAVATRPRNPSRCGKLGLGVLSVKDGGVGEMVKPGKREFPVFANYREKILDKCRRAPERVGGMPSLKGQGPAQDCLKRVAEYKKTHPDATWKELFENVPNHYCSHRSMCGALTAGIENAKFLRAMRKKRRRKR